MGVDFGVDIVQFFDLKSEIVTGSLRGMVIGKAVLFDEIVTAIGFGRWIGKGRVGKSVFDGGHGS